MHSRCHTTTIWGTLYQWYVSVSACYELHQSMLSAVDKTVGSKRASTNERMERHEACLTSSSESLTELSGAERPEGDPI